MTGAPAVTVVDLGAALAQLDQAYDPRIVGRYNDNKLVVVKVQGAFVWHAHPDTDDLFVVLSGRLVIDTREGSVEVGPGHLAVVPRGVEHRPRADEETHVLLIEPLGTPNTGDSGVAATPEREL